MRGIRRCRRCVTTTTANIIHIILIFCHNISMMATHANINRKIASMKFIRDLTCIPASQILKKHFRNGDPTIDKRNRRNSNSYTDFDMLAKGISVYLFYWMREDMNKVDSSIGLSNNKYNIPPIDTQLYDEFKCVNITESSIDDEVYQLVESNEIPSIYDIYKYLNYMKVKLNFVPPILILTCIYLKRICEAENIFLAISNYRLLFTVSLMIAQKIWIVPYKQTDEFVFAKNYTEDQLRLWEIELDSIIYEDIKIEPLLYENMYNNLKDLSMQVSVIQVSGMHMYEVIDNVRFPVRFGTVRLNEMKRRSRHCTSVDNIDTEISGSKPNLLNLRRKGVTNVELKALGYNIIDFVRAGYQIPDLLAANFTLKESLNAMNSSYDVL